MLTVEGVEPMGMMSQTESATAGCRSTGLTWNPANLAADGVGEPRREV